MFIPFFFFFYPVARALQSSAIARAMSNTGQVLVASGKLNCYSTCSTRLFGQMALDQRVEGESIARPSRRFCSSARTGVPGTVYGHIPRPRESRRTFRSVGVKKK